MKVKQFKCDQCAKFLSDSSSAINNKQHVSINFNKNSGCVEYNNYGYSSDYRWKFIKRVEGIKQFCDTKCMAKFIDNLEKC